MAIIAMISGCSKFDDSELWSAINQNSQKIAALQEQCNKMNSSIVTLQQLIGAIESGDFITNVAELADGAGYTIVFKSGKSIVIKNGKDGENGQNATAPIISIALDTDGNYYWTVNGQWLLTPNGDKLRAQGTDGKDGNDGITPQLKIEDGYWYISYNGTDWNKLGKAAGDNGLNGSDGDAFFSGVTMEDGYVIFTLNDGKNTQIKLPFVSDSKLTISINEPGTLKKILTKEQQRSVISLKIIGSINYDDLRSINCYLRALEELDLSESVIQIEDYTEYVKFNPYGSDGPNRTIRHLIVGRAIKNDENETKEVDLSYLFALETVTFTTNQTHINKYCLNDTGMSWPERECRIKGTPNFSTLIIAEGVTDIVTQDGSAYGDGTYTVAPLLDLPTTITRVGHYTFGLFAAKKVVCRANTPPSIYNYGDYGSGNIYKQLNSFYDAYNVLKEITLYVPKESIQAYKTANGWKQFGNILPIE